MQGTVQRVIRGKGFGFILVEGQQYFFHHTEIQNASFKSLVSGDVVEFEPQEDGEGRNPRATEVVVVAQKPRKPRRSSARARRGGSRPRDASAERRQPQDARQDDAPPSEGPPEDPPEDWNPDDDDDEFVTDMVSGGDDRRPGGRGWKNPRRKT